MQDARLRQGAGRQRYFMPTSMDKMVLAFRHWLGDLAGPIPWPADTLPSHSYQPSWSREQLLDRHNQHTRHCRQCSKVNSLPMLLLLLLLMPAPWLFFPGLLIHY